MAFYLSDSNGKLIKYASNGGNGSVDLGNLDTSNLVLKSQIGNNYISTISDIDKQNKDGLSIMNNSGNIPFSEWSDDQTGEVSGIGLLGNELDLLSLTRESNSEKSLIVQSGLMIHQDSNLTMYASNEQDIANNSITMIQNYVLLDESNAGLVYYKTYEDDDGSQTASAHMLVNELGFSTRTFTNDTETLFEVKENKALLDSQELATQKWVTDTLLGEGAAESLNTISELSAALKNNENIIDTLAVDTNVVHLSEDETINGVKKFTNPVWIEVNEPSTSWKNIVIKSSGTNNRPSVNIGYNTTPTWGGIVIGYSNTGSNGNVILGSYNNYSTNANDNIVIGQHNTWTGNKGGSNNVILGYYNTDQSISGDHELNKSIAIGYKAQIATIIDGRTAENIIQLGEGLNNNQNTFQVWNYQLLDGNTGKIPNERLNDNIATKTNIPAIVNCTKLLSTTEGITLDWNYKHQYLMFGEIIEVGQKILNLFPSLLNGEDYESNNMVIQECIVTAIDTTSNTISFIALNDAGFSLSPNHNLYHSLDMSDVSKKYTMSRYGISKAIEENKTIIRRWN